MIRNMHGQEPRPLHLGEWWTVESEAGVSYYRTRPDAAFAIHGLLLLRASGWAICKHLIDGREVLANAQ